MKLCIAEKPSVAGEIAKVIGASARHDGYYEGNGFYVTWTFGHLCELKEPHDYYAPWKSWSLYDLPLIPQRYGIKLKNDRGIAKQFRTIANLLRSVDEVINCGDAGQEGELIQRWVLQKAGMACPMKRLWISSLTEDAIRDGFSHLRPGSDFDNLYAAGSSRAIGDWLLGINATRAYTLKYAASRQVLSIGRVQTPTLSLIVQRHHEIVNFRPETYWELKTVYRAVTFAATKGRYNDVAEANAALERIKGTDFEITDIQRKDGQEFPPRLFDLTALQVECNRKYAFSADHTLSLIQQLYEKKLTTYPRVDTTYLSDDIYPKVPTILSGLRPYAQLVEPLLQQKIRKSKKVFDNSKVTDHHAIIPTGVDVTRVPLARDEKLVYDLVAKRFIANFYPESKISTTTVLGRAADVDFKATGKQILEPGWRIVYGTDRSREQKDGDEQESAETEQAVMPAFVKGERGEHKPALQEKQTQPPKPYTEATLLRAMETAGKQVDDEEMRDLMKENGIGRPSTRAAIIETLFKRKYIVKERKNLVPTVTGIQLIGIIDNPLLKSVELTGLWEKKLRQIEGGQYRTADFMTELKTMVADVVACVRNDGSGARVESVAVPTHSRPKAKVAAAPETKPAAPPKLVCPRCGRELVAGKSAWGCLGFREGCNFRIPFEFMGKKLTAGQVKQLLAKGETSVIKGFATADGKVDGTIALSESGELILHQAKAEKNVCPLCGGEIIKGKSAWGCANYKSGCPLRIPFETMGKRLTQSHLSDLLRKGETAVIRSLQADDGSKFNARLVLVDGLVKVGK